MLLRSFTHACRDTWDYVELCLPCARVSDETLLVPVDEPVSELQGTLSATGEAVALKAS